MNEKYKQWAVQAALMIALAVVLSLIQRYLGVKIDVPPPPPIQIVVTPGAEPGGATVTVVSPKP